MSNNALSWDLVLQATELAKAEARRLGLEPHHLAEKNVLKLLWRVITPLPGHGGTFGFV